jgi:hypothetical protein
MPKLVEGHVAESDARDRLAFSVTRGETMSAVGKTSRES